MLNTHYARTVVIQRKKTRSGNIQQFFATATADCSIQGTAPGSEAIQSGMFGKSFVAYMDADVPIQKSDRVIDERGTVYEVVEAVVHDYGAFPYQEVSLKTSS